MKKLISFVLLTTVILSFCLSGCSNTNSYIVHNDNIINLGVIVSESDNASYGAKVLEGIEYAAQLAPNVNMNSKYSIHLSVFDVNDNISDTVSKLIEDKAAAVICATESKTKSEEIIDAFSEYDTPLIFTDCYSDQVVSDEDSFVLSVPYSYQSSAAASYFTSQQYTKGTVIYNDDNYSSAFAELFSSTFVSGGGTNVDKLTEYDPATIASGNSEFVFIIGEPDYTLDVYSKLKKAGAKMPLMVSEVFDSSLIETTSYNDLLYISKFEIDVNNYIGTDFFSMYSSAKKINKEDVTSAEGYGYDAYMLVYGALMGFSSSLGTESEETDKEVTTAELKSAISKIVHLGVTDSISFDDSGLVNTNFVYLSTIINSQSTMLNRYNYTNGNNENTQ